MNRFICTLFVIVCSLSLIVLISACNADSSYEYSTLSAENGTLLFPEELLLQKVEWEKCELFDTKKRWRKAECADIAVPLHWDSPEGDKITIHVKRLKSWIKATKQMWLLEGGPGLAGTSTLPQLMKTIAQLDWRTDLYTLDHRGTGYSNRLGCPNQEADASEEGFTISDNEWDACIDYLEDTYYLDAFTVTQAAKDVGFLVELLQVENKEIFIFGTSYGTYWGHRYAQIFPDQADGVILDSILPSFYEGAERYDIHGNNVVKEFFDMCNEDTFCNSKMGDDPWDKANNTFEKFKNGHCEKVAENGLTAELLQTIAFNLLDDWDLRVVLPALYFRLDRCNDGDVTAIKYLMENFLPLIVPQGEEEVPFYRRQYSRALFYHIALTELMGDNPVSPEEMKEIDNTLLASAHLSYNFLQLLERWPTYEPDMYFHEWATQEVPLLMLNGTLDQRTPINSARIVEENLTGLNQYFIEVPNAGHGVIWQSPVKGMFAPNCGLQIILDYMKDPLEAPNRTCLTNLMPIDFRGRPSLAKLIFGVLDMWGNNGNASLTNDQYFLIEEEIEEIRYNLRRWPRFR